MRDQWTPRLSEYVDGGLDAPERRELEVHLGECAECTGTLAELRAVRSRAQALEDRPPTHDLWHGIMRRISRKAAVADIRAGPSWRRRRLSLSVPQLAAAGIALMLVSAGGVWLGVSQQEPAATADGSAGATVFVAPVSPAAFTSEDYDAAVTELRQILERHRAQLDSATVRVLEENLATIDQAIADARAALASDPANRFLNAHLAETLRRKVWLLSRAAAIASTAS